MQAPVEFHSRACSILPKSIPVPTALIASKIDVPAPLLRLAMLRFPSRWDKS